MLFPLKESWKLIKIGSATRAVAAWEAIAAVGNREKQRALISQIIRVARKIKDRVERTVVGAVNTRQLKDLEEQVVNIDDSWVHSFETSAVIHNQKQRGNARLEANRGQIAITDEDYARIPEILASYDKVTKSPNRSRSTGNEVLIYEKDFGDGYVYYLEEKRDKRKSLAFQTMYKKKQGTDSPDGLMPNASPSTPIALSDNLSSFSERKDSDSSEEKQEPTAESSGTALQRMPRRSDAKGKEVIDWGGAETALAWDALVETAGGDAELAQALAEKRLAAAEKALAAAKKANVNGDEDFEGYIAAFKEAERMVGVWKAIAGENARRAEAALIAELEASRERERLRNAENARDAAAELGSVPPIDLDVAANARARGFRRVDDERVERQQPLTPATVGNEVEVRFTKTKTQKCRVAVIDASELQPSHRQGHRNPMHFIDEAQPKERTNRQDGGVSAQAARDIANNVRPAEITGSVSAYVGAPVVNGRGEVIQGNNRADALTWMWRNNAGSATRYKQYLIDHADEFGIDAAAVAAMEAPVLVNMADVNDDEAIALGQHTSTENESGGSERISAVHTVSKLGRMAAEFVGRIMRGDEAMSIVDRISTNGEDVLNWLAEKGIITETQLNTATYGGAITREGAPDLLQVVKRLAFADAAPVVERVFEQLPVAAQNAILSVAYRDNRSPEGQRLLPEIQASILAYSILLNYKPFHDAKTVDAAREAMEKWSAQTEFDTLTGESVHPSDNFSNFALELAVLYRKGTQKNILVVFNDIFDLIQGQPRLDYAAEGVTGAVSLAEAVRRVLNTEYTTARNNGQKQNDGAAGGSDVGIDGETGQPGRPGSHGDAAGSQQEPRSPQSADRRGGAENDSPQEVNASSKPSGEENVSAATPESKPTFLDAVKALYEKGKSAAAKLYARAFFDLTKTPAFMNELGLTGEKFTIRYGVIARHFGKDSEHTLPAEIWAQLPQAVKSPFAITEYYTDENKEVQKGYRLYTELRLANGSYVVVSVVVKNAGRDLEVNAINTIFGRRSLSQEHDKLIYTSKNITPDQQSLLDGNNPHQYPAGRELSGRKDNATSEEKQEVGAESSKKSVNLAEREARGEQSDGAVSAEITAKLVEFARKFKGAGARGIPAIERDMSECMSGWTAEDLVGLDARALAEVCNRAGLDKGKAWAFRMSIDKATPKGLVEEVFELRDRRRREVRGPQFAVGAGSPGNAEVYETAKGLLERAGITFHEVSDVEAQAMLAPKSDGTQLMGSRTDRKMAEVGSHFAGRELDGNAQAVVDVFSGKRDNVAVEVERPEGKKRVVMRQGRESKAGTKHSLFRHFRTSSNYITADDIALIPEIIAKGERSVTGNKIAYDYTIEDGVRLRVTTEKHGMNERFTNFLSNREPRQEKRAENTQSSAPRSDAEVSAAKVSNNSENGKPQLLRTADGVVYGWTVNGEVWLNRDAMNPETPLHEYTHLWDAMVRRENPELWARGKELMKQTPLWQEVLDDPNYADIRENEDAVASEVHARLTGRRGAGRLESMIEGARKEDPLTMARKVALVERLKGWLHDMFKEIKATLGKWSGRDLRGLTAEQFADMTLRDLAEGVNPRSGDKTLVAVHNISEAKLREALDLGGLPMPSIAITKAATGHGEFGEISLVFGKESIDPSDRRNKVYSGDAWTPRFPTVGYKLNSAKTSEIYERANRAGHLPLFRAVDFHPDNYERRIDGNGDSSLVDAFMNDYSAKQLFLSEKGKAVTEYEWHEVEKYTPENIGLYEKMLEQIGLERLRNDSYETLLPELKKLIGEYRGEKCC